MTTHKIILFLTLKCADNATVQNISSVTETGNQLVAFIIKTPRMAVNVI